MTISYHHMHKLKEVLATLDAVAEQVAAMKSEIGKMRSYVVSVLNEGEATRHEANEKTYDTKTRNYHRFHAAKNAERLAATKKAAP